MNIISSNPYRLLGVYSNSPIKDRIANSNKLKAYLKVGKSVSFPLDLSNLIPVPIRTSESMEHANGCINLPLDQLKYAFFWFIKVSFIDEIALNYLQNGNIEKAKELFEKKETFSSLVNLGVLALIQNDKATAIQSITKVIHNEDYRTSFVEAVCGGVYQLSEDEFARLFMDGLLSEIPIQELMQLFGDNGTAKEDNGYLKNKAVSEPIAAINAEIMKAKSVKNNNAEAQYKAGVSLLNNTKVSLATIRNFLKINDMQYLIVVDNLAKQILQCGINYYNNSEEDEYVKINKTYKLQSEAYSIAMGKLTKDRCKENMNILDNKKKELPPVAVKEYNEFIKKELLRYQRLPNLIKYAIELIKNCVPYLMSIKDELGSTNPYYLNLSTLIVNSALHNVIEEFNSVNNDSLSFDLLMDRERTICRIKDVFKEAWLATLYMDKLDMKEDFKVNRYFPNRATLKEQVSSIGILTYYQTIQLEMRSDLQMFNDCNSVSACRRYLEIFPNGKFVAKIKAKMEEYEFGACVTTQDCSVFKKKYPNTKFAISRKWEECYFNTCITIEDYRGYLNAYPDGRFVLSAKIKIEELVFRDCKNIDDYRAYLQKYPSGVYKNEAQGFVVDEEFWQNCVASGTKNDYLSYLAQFPNGRHKVEAQRKASTPKGESWVAVALSWLFLISILAIFILLALKD